MQDLTYEVTKEKVEVFKNDACIATINCDGLIHFNNPIPLPADYFKIILLRKDLFKTNHEVTLEMQNKIEDQFSEESISFLVKDNVYSYLLNSQPIFQFNESREIVYQDPRLPIALRKKWVHALLFDEIGACIMSAFEKTKYTDKQQNKLVESFMILQNNFPIIKDFINPDTPPELISIICECIMYQFQTTVVKLVIDTYQKHKSVHLCQLLIQEVIQDTSLNKIKQAIDAISSQKNIDFCRLDRLLDYQKQDASVQQVLFKSVDENRYQILVEDKEVGNIDTKTGEVKLNRKVITAEIDDEIQAKIQELQSSLEKGREL